MTADIRYRDAIIKILYAGFFINLVLILLAFFTPDFLSERRFFISTTWLGRDSEIWVKSVRDNFAITYFILLNLYFMEKEILIFSLLELSENKWQFNPKVIFLFCFAAVCWHTRILIAPYPGSCHFGPCQPLGGNTEVFLNGFGALITFIMYVSTLYIITTNRKKNIEINVKKDEKWILWITVTGYIIVGVILILLLIDYLFNLFGS